MTTIIYGQSNFYDASSTISCAGSPIILSSIANYCNFAVQENTNSLTCAPYSGPFGEYKMQQTMCTANGAIDFSGFKRNYVTLTTFASSSSCGGQPLMTVAVAADAMCHMNPLAGGGTITDDTGDFSTYLSVNCNGGQPIWKSCSDVQCTKCTTRNYSNTPCQLTSAGASVKVECVLTATETAKGNSSSLPSSSRGNATLDTTVPYQTFQSSSSLRWASSRLLVSILIICSISPRM